MFYNNFDKINITDYKGIYNIATANYTFNKANKIIKSIIKKIIVLRIINIFLVILKYPMTMLNF